MPFTCVISDLENPSNISYLPKVLSYLLAALVHRSSHFNVLHCGVCLALCIVKALACKHFGMWTQQRQLIIVHMGGVFDIKWGLLVYIGRYVASGLVYVYNTVNDMLN